MCMFSLILMRSVHINNYINTIRYFRGVTQHRITWVSQEYIVCHYFCSVRLLLFKESRNALSVICNLTLSFRSRSKEKVEGVEVIKEKKKEKEDKEEEKEKDVNVCIQAVARQCLTFP